MVFTTSHLRSYAWHIKYSCYFQHSSEHISEFRFVLEERSVYQSLDFLVVASSRITYTFYTLYLSLSVWFSSICDLTPVSIEGAAMVTVSTADSKHRKATHRVLWSDIVRLLYANLQIYISYLRPARVLFTVFITVPMIVPEIIFVETRVNNNKQQQLQWDSNSVELFDLWAINARKPNRKSMASRSVVVLGLQLICKKTRNLIASLFCVILNKTKVLFYILSHKILSHVTFQWRRIQQ
jgi:hypothetical protein